MRIAHVSLFLLAVGGALGCASAPRPQAIVPATRGTQPPRPGPSERSVAADVTPRAPEAVTTGLVFTVEPLDAEIAVDGRPVGAVDALAGARGFLPLPPGIYQVSLKAPGHVTWRAEVAVRSSTEPIRVKLTRKP